MCGEIWTQDQYRNSVGYIITEYENDNGEQAITVKDDVGDYSNIYSQDGHDYEYFWFLDGQYQLADQAMRARGFHLKDAGTPTGPLPVETDTQSGVSGISSRTQRGTRTASTGDRASRPARPARSRKAAAVADPVDVTMDATKVWDAPSTDQAVMVQGRTMAQWTEEGKLNEDRPLGSHVHPEPPKGREPNDQEMEAWIESLTMDEGMLVLIGSMGGLSSLLSGGPSELLS